MCVQRLFVFVRNGMDVEHDLLDHPGECVRRLVLVGPVDDEAIVPTDVLLTTHGRRSGKERTVILQFIRDGDDLVLAAANEGGSSHPSWYCNLKANPTARVETMGRRLAVSAEEMTEDEAAAFWPRLLRRAELRALPASDESRVSASSPRSVAEGLASGTAGTNFNGEFGQPVGFTYPA